MSEQSELMSVISRAMNDSGAFALGDPIPPGVYREIADAVMASGWRQHPTPLETQHITAECRTNRSSIAAWLEAMYRLAEVYGTQVDRRPDATVSVAIYVTEP